MNLQIFSQDTNSVHVRLIDGKEFIVMSPEKGRGIATDLIEGDSCCDRSIYLESKINTLNQIIEGDSLDLSNSNKNLNKCQHQIKILRLKEGYQKTLIKLAKEEVKFYKRQRIKTAILGLLGGTVIGIIIK